jgi:hypothetical protein
VILRITGFTAIRPAWPSGPSFAAKKKKKKKTDAPKKVGKGAENNPDPLPKMPPRPAIIINNPFGDFGSQQANMLRDVIVDATLDEVIDALSERPQHPAGQLYDETRALVTARWKTKHPRPTPVSRASVQRQWLFDFVDHWSRWEVLPQGFVHKVNEWVGEHKPDYEKWLNTSMVALNDDLTDWRLEMEMDQRDREIATMTNTIDIFTDTFRTNWVDQLESDSLDFKGLTKQARRERKRLRQYLNERDKVIKARAKAKGKKAVKQ